MLLVSLLLFVLLEIGTGDITVKILGVFSTPEQRESFANQLGLDAPAYRRYLDWLIGSDRRAEQQVGDELGRSEESEHRRAGMVGERRRRADALADGGRRTRQALVRQADGSTESEPAAGAIWTEDEDGNEVFWGVDTKNNAVQWMRGAGAEIFVLTKAGMRKEGDAPVDYIPLTKGLCAAMQACRLQTGRPVSVTLVPRVRNTLVLAVLRVYRRHANGAGAGHSRRRQRRACAGPRHLHHELWDLRPRRNL